jgi:hypothetical protein
MALHNAERFHSIHSAVFMAASIDSMIMVLVVVWLGWKPKGLLFVAFFQKN